MIVYAYLFKKSLYFDQTLCHKVFSDTVRSAYPGIYHFIFKGMLSQSTNFYGDNIILRYYQIQPKVVWKVVHGWMDTISRKRQKHYHNEKLESVIYSV